MLLTLFYSMWWWFPDQGTIAKYPKHGLARLFATRLNVAANSLNRVFAKEMAIVLRID
jgi:hypothetical protein